MKFKRLKPLFAELLAQADRVGVISLERWIKTEGLKHAVLPILVEGGQDSSLLIIAFAGGAQKLGMPIHDFFETTKTLGCSKILLRDRYKMFYHFGVDRKRRDWPTLVRYLREETERLRPKKTICIGSSGGGYAAIIAGYFLGADYVHAFGPQTVITVDKAAIRKARHPYKRWRLSVSRRALRDAFDLGLLLKKPNGKSTYFIHYGYGHKVDRDFATRISDLPSVVTLGYPCEAHAVAVFLAKKRFLHCVLESKNQDRLVEIARAHFGEKMVVTSSIPADSTQGDDLCGDKKPWSSPTT